MEASRFRLMKPHFDATVKKDRFRIWFDRWNIRDVRTLIFYNADSLTIEPSRQRFKIFAILRILPRRRNCEDIYTKFDERLIEVFIDGLKLFPLELSGWSKVTFRSRGQFANIKPWTNLYFQDYVKL